MRVLFLTPRLPFPPNRGGEITVFNFLRVLSRRHELSLVSFYDRPEELAYRGDLERYCRHVEMVPRPTKLAPAVLARTLFGRRSYAVERHASGRFAAAVREMVARATPDVVQIETFLMGQYLDELRPLPTVLDMHNVTWLLWDRSVAVAKPWVRMPLAIQAARLRRDEVAVCRAVDVCAPVSDADRRELHRVAGPSIRSVVVTPGVDCDLFQPVVHGDTGPEILFVGSMNYPPNIDAAEYFCRDILPRVAAVIPGVRLSIVGANPTPSMLGLAGERVVVTGFVPDVRPYYERAAVVVVPLRVGGGIRMKILEGLALGAPMVSTSVGAEGLGLSDGRELLLADEPQRFADAVVRLIGDRGLRQRLSQQARDAAVRRFSWEAVGATLTDLYQSLVPPVAAAREPRVQHRA
ncbi:MAG TPA: glycosyltransferase family 4 protein [Vicinamibacterales bacterium]|nr:glycosyltransferase family 4 protein [Vicinamibacterales bacterium]